MLPKGGRNISEERIATITFRKKTSMILKMKMLFRNHENSFQQLRRQRRGREYESNRNLRESDRSRFAITVLKLDRWKENLMKNYIYTSGNLKLARFLNKGEGRRNIWRMDPPMYMYVKIELSEIRLSQRLF